MKTIRMVWRQAKRNRLMTFVNLAGLSISTAVLILLSLLILHEVRYDRTIPNSEQLVLVGSYMHRANGQELRWPIISSSVPVDLKREVPGIENYVRFQGAWDRELAMVTEEKQVTARGVFTTDSSFFDVTGVELSQGNPDEALVAPNSIVITRAFAEKMFGEDDPLGREVMLNGNRPVTVTGIIERMPAPGMLNGMNVLLSWSTYDRNNPSWNSNINYYCLLKLTEGLTAADIRQSVDEATERHFADRNRDDAYSFILTLTPLHDLHLYGFFDPFPLNSGRIYFVLQFVIMGVFLLIIAVLNYINLTTAQSFRRGVFVGIAKVMGANKTMLMRQFITESIIITTLAMFVGVLLAYIMLPYFSNMVDITLIDAIGNIALIPFILLAVGVVMGGVTGFVPALILSNTKPISAFKKQYIAGKKGSRLRGSLVVLQFAVATILIIGSMVVLKQMKYIRSADLGFDRENVLTVRMGNWDLMQSYHTLYEKYRIKPYVISSSSADHLPIQAGNVSSYHVPGTPDDQRVYMCQRNVDHHYLETVGLHLVEGRNFDPDISSDSLNAVIINQTAARTLGLGDNPVGKSFEQIRFAGTREYGEANIIGVVEDFHFQSLRDKIEPLFLRIYEGYPPWLIFRLQPGSEARAIADLENLWTDFAPGIPLQYSFLDERFDAMYRSEQRLSKLFRLFTFIAIIIAGMGLFAMSAFIAERKTKEIGVRKVLGASIRQIVTMLVSDFIKLVLVANLIAWPLSWWIMNRWLEGYAYRTQLDVQIFISTLALSLVLALIAVSVHAVRASLINPVKTLRDE